MRLILASRVDPEERSRTLTGFDLELSNVEEEPGQAYFEVWLTSFEAGLTSYLDGDTIIHYVDDLPIGVRYFVVKAAPIWQERLRQSFPILTDEDILERARRARDDQERIEATYILALIAGRQVREPILTELTSSLRHSSEAVRHAAVPAVGYAQWPALVDMLDDIAVRDSSARVRERAESMRGLLTADGKAARSREGEL